MIATQEAPARCNRWTGIDPLRFVPHPSFDLPGVEDELFGPTAPVIEIPPWRGFPLDFDDQAPVVTGHKRRLSADSERTLFLRYNYARCRLRELVQAQERREVASRVPVIALWRGRVQDVYSQIVTANMGLSLVMARRTRIVGVEMDELVSEGNVALLRAVEAFDVSRGFKFSTYACAAIHKSFRRMCKVTARRNGRFYLETDHDDPRGLTDLLLARPEFPDPQSIADLLACPRLDRREREVLSMRYDMGMDLDAIGRTFKRTKEWARVIINAALAKLRKSMGVSPRTTKRKRT